VKNSNAISADFVLCHTHKQTHTHSLKEGDFE